MRWAYCALDVGMASDKHPCMASTSSLTWWPPSNYLGAVPYHYNGVVFSLLSLSVNATF